MEDFGGDVAIVALCDGDAFVTGQGWRIQCPHASKVYAKGGSPIPVSIKLRQGIPFCHVIHVVSIINGL